MSLSGLKDVDREILKHVDDEELLKICTINRKTWNEVCDDNFLRRRLMKYPGIEEYKFENESWKQFYLRVLYYVSRMQEEYEYKYNGGDFRLQYDLLGYFKGNKLLIEAARKGELGVVKYAIDKGADHRAIDDYALKLAIYNGHSSVAKFLLSKSDISTRNAALRWASDAGRLDIVKYILEDNEDIYTLQVPFQMAVRFGHLEIVKYLVEKGADIHEEAEDALRRASLTGNLELVKYLVEQGANIHAEEDDALVAASARGHLEVVKYLVQQGAIVHDGNNGAIYWAKRNDHPLVVEYLLSLEK